MIESATHALRALRARLALADEGGQAMMEYATLTAFILGGAVLSAPFLVDFLNAMDQYMASIYWVLQAPIP